MDVLFYAQTLYYFIASFAIIVLGILFAIITYHLISVSKHLQNISENLDDSSVELKERIEEVIERLSSLPLFSYFLKSNKEHGVHHTHHKRS